MSVTLFISPGACAMASHVALLEAGIDHETQVVDLRTGQQRTPEYLAVNPAGSTPALKTDQGVITQNAAILAWAAQTRPDKSLAPVDDAFAFARFNAFNGWLASSLHPALGKVLFSRPPLEGEAKTQAIEFALSKLDLAESHLVEGPWAFGETWTLTDGYLMVFERWARQAKLLDTARFPKLNAHLDKVQSRDAVKRMLADEGLEAV
ncbi:glutathione S-transferase family protein [Brevundimonas sp.]|jgi:glutathione S-transferase|uniref:glutathione S-transferase family protein n=1 Tax=Brevundimonas sp. TaxID=1871086 RepID=UPI002E145093|nr:glutathione S-transferase N-terminal domain-containing protein [Brevundimonas sp.]